ncbi:odontogenic ameloblast-associated protein [Sorex fumeus]|uniref:odontogenic ameloblast-associated protein n=1 Tax=Sorex fumeus TaxID=62283 RepID=UPI0024AD15A5|nr:odontogenic ameloblast-associated protein [Sorex fumeus]
MKIIIFLGLLGATMPAPLIPQRLLSASHSHELLLNLNNGQLLPLQFQGPFNSWIPSFSGVPQQQQQTRNPSLSQFSATNLERFVKPFPNQVPSPGQVGNSRGTQVGPLELSKPQTPSQTQQNPNHVLPYIFPFKMPQEQTQMLQYYPIYMFLPWEQTATQSPAPTGQQQYEEQMPIYTQIGYIPQLAEPVVPGGQQQITFDPVIISVPETAAVPAGGVMPYFQNEMIDFKHASAGIAIPSTSPKPSTTNFFAPVIDPTITPELMEEKTSGIFRNKMKVLLLFMAILAITVGFPNLAFPP